MESILIIEDDPDVLNSISETLQGEGYTTFKADNKESGLKLAKQKAPDLILCDIQLPEGDEGFEILEELRNEKTTHSLPFIFLTRRDESKDIVRGLKLGAQDYVSKAAEDQEILARIKMHLELTSLRKKLEQGIITRDNELELKHKELEHLYMLLKNKNQSLEDFRRFASEKVKNKLTVIKCHIESLTMDYTSNIPITSKLEQIGVCCGDIQIAVEDFLEK